MPWRPTRGSLTSPSYLVRNRTLGPPLENNPEIPPSSRAEGLRLLQLLFNNSNFGDTPISVVLRGITKLYL